MTTIFPIDDDDETIEIPSSGDVIVLRKKLEERCKVANIKFEEVEGIDDEIACRIFIPSGRDSRSVYCWDYDDYMQLLDIQFERYVIIQGFDATCNYETGEIEACIRPMGVASTRLLYSRLFGIPVQDFLDRQSEAFLQVESPDNDNKITISLSSRSHEISVLTRSGSQSRLSIKIVKPGLKQHDQALELLRRVTDAIFFQIDLIHDIPLVLVRDRRSAVKKRSKKRLNATDIIFPAQEYDSAPISLYWYARSAVGMPLLQFLAFYQVIEFYYPTYSQAEARRKIKTILKDPAFRAERDADLGKLLSAIHITRSGGVGDERAQLRATLLECTDAEALREFVSSDVERMNFLSSKAKGLSEHKLPVTNATADLRSDVAERIYEIRCKIVHTKTDSRNGEFDLLLPFSREAEQLSFDIELVQYVAQQVLIAASMPFQS